MCKVGTLSLYQDLFDPLNKSEIQNTTGHATHVVKSRGHLVFIVLPPEIFHILVSFWVYSVTPEIQRPSNFNSIIISTYM